MSPKLGKNQSPILVKILMIQKNSPQKNHQNWWHFLVKKMSLNLEQNYSQNKVKILVIQQIFLQKCHRDWWKSDGITKICANFVENQGGLIYAVVTVTTSHYCGSILQFNATESSSSNSMQLTQWNPVSLFSCVMHVEVLVASYFANKFM